MTNKQPEALWLADVLAINDTPINMAAAAELRRLHQTELAFKQWIEKSEWVQETAQIMELGMHRADAMKQRIDRLHEVNIDLRKALEECAEELRHRINSDYQTSETDDPGSANSAYLKAHAAIAKATGEQQ